MTEKEKETTVETTETTETTEQVVETKQPGFEKVVTETPVEKTVVEKTVQVDDEVEVEKK